MIKKTKGRAGEHQATQKTTYKHNSTCIFSHVKVAIVLAVLGWLPIRLAEHTNRIGGAAR